jgi:DNA-binding response OmpR family regulator
MCAEGLAMPTVLLVGEDEMLLNTRAAVLRTAGVDTLCCAPTDALALQADRECEGVVLCHSLPEAIYTTLAQAIHTHWPATRILLVTTGRAWTPAEVVAAVDAVTQSDPERLIRRTVELLSLPTQPPTAHLGR